MAFPRLFWSLVLLFSIIQQGMLSASVCDLSSQNLTSITSVLSTCVHLPTELNLSANHLTNITSQDFLNNNLYRIETLDLSHNIIMSIDHDAFYVLRSLRTLTLRSNYIEYIPDGMLDNNFHLTDVDLSHNHIKEIGDYVFTTNLYRLKYVDISYNNLTSVDGWPFLLNHVKEFDFSHNCISNFSNRLQWRFKMNDKIPYMNLQYNAFRVWRPEVLQIFLNKGEEVNAATILLVFYGLDLRNNQWICDCNLHYIVKDFRESFVRTAGLETFDIKCTSPPELAGIPLLRSAPLSKLVCNISKHCPKECLCQDRPDTNIVYVNCDKGNLYRLPNNLPVIADKGLSLSLNHNHIDVINLKHYTKYIVELSVSHNALTKIDNEAIRQMSKLRYLNIEHNRIASLPLDIQYVIQYDFVKSGHNPFVCNCDMMWMTDWIRRSDEENENRNIECTFNDKETFKILELTSSLLKCSHTASIAIGIGFGATFVSIIAVVIWAKRCPYETKVLVYKFFNFHPQDKYVVDKEIDKDVDVYVSFDDNDIYVRQWVLRKLAKRLEEQKPLYKSFIPVRDLDIGGEKCTDIVQNMQKSKRFIIILSSECEKNEWFLFECQQAEVLDSIDDRIIFIKYHPEADQMLSNDPWKSRANGRKVFSLGENRSERRWFWDKLKYELPVK